MTLQFVSFYKQSRKCAPCLTLAGKKMCSGCLAQAQVQWHGYVARRHQKGLCITCPRKRQKNEQRCPTCAELNRARCWSYYHATRKFHVQELRTKGICIRCTKNLAGEGHSYCALCRNTIRALANGLRQPVKKPYKFLSLAFAEK